MKENEQELEEFIRDICKVTPMSKSEARRRLDLIIHQAIAEERARVVEEIKRKKGYAVEQLKTEKDAELIEYLCGERNLANDLLSSLKDTTKEDEI